MSLIELLIMIAGIIGAIKGATLGLSLYGIIGLILAIPIGFIGGASLIVISLILIMFFVDILKYISSYR
jgi:hypothetical protein